MIERPFDRYAKHAPLFRPARTTPPSLRSPTSTLITPLTTMRNGTKAVEPAWTTTLEARWDTIRAEAAQVLFNSGTPPLLAPDATADQRWKSFFLWGYGYRMTLNCDRCPQTARLIDGIPNLTSAFFSVLAPGTSIQRHGTTDRGLLTCHLGLMVPAERDACRMTIGYETVHWTAGKCLVFDDSQVREIRNDTSEFRVVLLLQIKQPTGWVSRVIADLFRRRTEKSARLSKTRPALEAWCPAAEFKDSDRG